MKKSGIMKIDQNSHSRDTYASTDVTVTQYMLHMNNSRCDYLNEENLEIDNSLEVEVRYNIEYEER